MEELELAEFKPNTAKAVQFQCVDEWSALVDDFRTFLLGAA